MNVYIKTNNFTQHKTMLTISSSSIDVFFPLVKSLVLQLYFDFGGR